MNDLLAQARESVNTRLGIFAFIGATLALLAGFVIARFGMLGMAGFVGIPVAAVAVIAILIQPRIGLIIYLQVCFVVNGLFRFIPADLPYGLLADAVLLLSLLGVLLNARNMDWKRLHSPVFYIVLAWFAYTCLLFFNPLSPYPLAWVYSIRAISFYWLEVTVLSLLLFRNREDVKLQIKLWLFWSVLAALWAFKQQYIGLTAGEVAWLNAGAAGTHMLFGHLRGFSFYSDAGQFGAEMAYATLLAIVGLLEKKGLLNKLIYGILAIILFWGYAVSGTRGALAVLLVGLPIYALLRRKTSLLVGGMFLAGLLFGALKFTSLGSSNYQIQRMRTAFDPADESLQVRLNNQQKLKEYLSDKPFGVGVGASGEMASRYAPDSFLANTPPDSWLVKIWIETGVVGLVFFLMIVLSAFLIGYHQISGLRESQLKIDLSSLLAGFMGICVASYGNPIFGQFPTNSIMYISMVMFTTSLRFEKANLRQEPLDKLS